MSQLKGQLAYIDFVFHLCFSVVLISIWYFKFYNSVVFTFVL